MNEGGIPSDLLDSFRTDDIRPYGRFDVFYFVQVCSFSGGEPLPYDIRRFFGISSRQCKTASVRGGLLILPWVRASGSAEDESLHRTEVCRAGDVREKARGRYVRRYYRC